MTRRLPLLGLALVIAAMAVAFTSACSSDAGTRDAGAPEAGAPEAGAPDADTPDIGMPDSASRDGTPADAAPPDGAPADAGTSDALSDDAICAEGCRLATLACGGDEPTCVGLCRQDFATGPCHAEQIAVQLCWIAVGLDALECMNGRTFLRAGFCEQEKHTLTNCLF